MVELKETKTNTASSNLEGSPSQKMTEKKSFWQMLRATFKDEGRAWLMISCGAFFYAYQFILRVSPNVMNNEMMETFMIGSP